jgi:hypothetical protein
MKEKLIRATAIGATVASAAGAFWFGQRATKLEQEIERSRPIMKAKQKAYQERMKILEKPYAEKREFLMREHQKKYFKKYFNEIKQEKIAEFKKANGREPDKNKLKEIERFAKTQAYALTRIEAAEQFPPPN